MATSSTSPGPAPSSERIEESDGDITYVRTDADLPPVAVIDRSPITTKHKVVFAVIALLGAIAWAVIAFFRGETVNAVWFVIAAICTYVIGFRFYARLIEMKIVKPRDEDATPAEVFENGTDYKPTDRRVLFGHHFAADRRCGPARRSGAGDADGLSARHHLDRHRRDLRRLRAGHRRAVPLDAPSTARASGRWLATRSARSAASPRSIAVLVIMIILLAVLALVVVNALAESPWGTFSIAMTIPIALFMGFYLRFLRPGRVSETSLIGVVLLLLAIVAGGWVPELLGRRHRSRCPRPPWSCCLIGYGFVASVLPVWMLLAPRDYLSTFMKIGTIVLLAVGVVVARPVLAAPSR